MIKFSKSPSDSLVFIKNMSQENIESLFNVVNIFTIPILIILILVIVRLLEKKRNKYFNVSLLAILILTLPIVILPSHVTETVFSKQVKNVDDEIVNYKIEENPLMSNIITMKSKDDRVYKIKTKTSLFNYDMDRFKRIIDNEPTMNMDIVGYFKEIDGHKETLVGKEPKEITLITTKSNLTPQEFDKFLDILEKTTYK